MDILYNTMVTIALLDASVGDTPAQENFERAFSAEVETFKVSEGAFPPVPSAFPFDGAVISGSQTAVYDERDWIREVEAWVREAHEARIPMLGVCWGHQVLARALGGRVADMGGYELGYETVHRVAASPLFRGIDRAFTAFETHSDAVVELPPDGRVLARNDTAVQAFQVGRTYGVQFHPEYDNETARWVIGNKDLPAERTNEALATVTEANYEAAGQARRVFENFCRVVAGTPACASVVTPRR